jgi:hypothetical protein
MKRLMHKKTKMAIIVRNYKLVARKRIKKLKAPNKISNMMLKSRKVSIEKPHVFSKTKEKNHKFKSY